MKTRIQYPLEGDSKVLDGRLHDIIINDLTEVDINGEKYYIAFYNDVTASNRKMFTFLKIVNGVMCKVPLKEYNMERITRMLESCPSRVLSEDEMAEVIPEVIGLADTTTIEDIANNGEIRARNVTIQYPYVPTNEGIDGNVHQITPINVVRCNVHGLDLYYLEYYDLNLGHRMITFLIRIDGALYKVPLTSYNSSEIERFVSTYGVSLVDPVSLFAGAGIPTDKPSIGLAMTMSLDSIINIRTMNNEPIIEYPYYIPYNPENPMSISDRVFRSSCRVHQGSDVDFVFDKERNGSQIENAIREEIRRNMDKIERGESFFIEIETRIPSGTTVPIPTKDGRMVLAQYIPGIHRHRIFLTPCDKKDLDKPTRLCERLSIRTNTDYASYDENHEVFEGGYKGILPISFLGLPREYTDRTTFYATKEPVVPTIDAVDYFAVPAVANLRDFYIQVMSDVYGLDGTVLFGMDYVTEYEVSLVESIKQSLSDLGYSRIEIFSIVEKIQQEFAQKLNSVKKGV